LYDGQIHEIDSLNHSNERSILLNDEQLKIPYRVYFNEPQRDREKDLTDTQKSILNCIYLRHHNGFIRQKRLELLSYETNYFIIPCTFQLLGEYVMEILEVLNRHVNINNINNYVKFIRENKKYWKQTESRMISYWNEYYRSKFPKLKDYIGAEIVDKLKKANAQHEYLQYQN
jgi:hypothetical protein